MAFSEGLSDTGDMTGRGNPYVRGAITGVGTFLGGILHTLPFLIPQYQAALTAAVITVALELMALAWIRSRFFHSSLLGKLLTPSRSRSAVHAVRSIINGLNVGDPLFNKLGATVAERTFCDSGSCTAYMMTIGPGSNGTISRRAVS